MSVHDRLDDARVLYAAGRRTGALLSVLVAVAATSRKRYPKSDVPSDGDAFRKFVAEEMMTINGVLANYCAEQARTAAGRFDRAVKARGMTLGTFLESVIAERLSGSETTDLQEIEKILGSGVYVHFRDQTITLDDLLYRFVRCELAHEATLPDDVVFLPRTEGRMRIQVTDNQVILDDAWIEALAGAVESAPENASDKASAGAEAVAPLPYYLTVLLDSETMRRLERIASARGMSMSTLVAAAIHGIADGAEGD